MSKLSGLPCPRCNGLGRVPDDRVLGATMRKRRTARGLSLRDLAKRLDLTASYLCELELGRRRWGPEIVKRYEDELA